MAKIASRPDSILVSEETVKDFQLHPGDHVTLRLQTGQTKQYTNVKFSYVGIAREFPTAPRDSFLIANADYIARQTGSDAVGAFLVNTGGSNVTGVADTLRRSSGTNAQVTDIVSSRKVIGSSLTAVDLAGLTKVELGFALALAGASTGLVLWLGLAERRRTWAITTALGATPAQLGAFVWVEGALVAGCGLIAGALSGWAVSVTLVKVLSGVFDPAPSQLAVPWIYLGTVGVIAIAASATAATLVIRSSRRPAPELLRAI
jgi:putative ABC transport system permease protein